MTPNMNCIHATDGVCPTCLAATHHTHADAIEAGTQALVARLAEVERKLLDPAMWHTYLLDRLQASCKQTEARAEQAERELAELRGRLDAALAAPPTEDR
jgi:phage shock protein A